MCFDTGSTDTTTYSAAPTAVNTGDSEEMQQAAQRKRNRARSNGFSANIVGGNSALTGSTSGASLKGTLG